MEEGPLPTIKTNEKIESIEINQNKENYILYINSEDNSIELNILKDEIYFYTRKMSLDEIKRINNALLGLNSCQEFSDFIIKLVEKNELIIRNNEENITLSFNIELLFKKQLVEIVLFLLKIKIEQIVKNSINELKIIKKK